MDQEGSEGSGAAGQGKNILKNYERKKIQRGRMRGNGL